MFRLHGHVRIERVGLEHERHVARARRQSVDAPTLEMDFAVGDGFESRQHAQECRLSASGRAEKDKKLAVRDSQVDIVDRRDAAPGLGDMLESDRGHGEVRPAVSL